MFESIGNFFKKIVKPENKELGSKDSAKERLHLVLMQDRANVSADFLELMKQEIIDVIKKYIVVDDDAIDVRLTNKVNEDGTNGAPALYANIPIINIKNEMKAEKLNEEEIIEEENKENKIDDKKQNEEIEVIKKEHNNNEEDSDLDNPIKDNNENEEIDDSDLENELDDDDDVTFDDLLKAAEEEDKKKVSKE